MIWQTARFQIDLSAPRVMGIVNVTPDSFSDGGRYQTVTAALRHCERLILDGADILDLGGESSRPGSVPVPLAEELGRVDEGLDVLEAAASARETMTSARLAQVGVGARRESSSRSATMVSTKNDIHCGVTSKTVAPRAQASVPAGSRW